MSDEAVLKAMESFSSIERGAIADSVACLAEVVRRKLFRDAGYADVYDYCIVHLRYSIGAAYRRVNSARAADLRTEIYSYLKSGELNLCVLSLIADEIEFGDADAALRASLGKSKKEVEKWLAGRREPEPAAPDVVKIRPPLPSSPTSPFSSMFDLSADAAVPGCHAPAGKIGPIFGSQTSEPAYSYSFTASAELHRAIERLKDMLWSRYPFGTLDEFLKVAVTEYLTRHDLSLKLPKPVPEPARDKAALPFSRYVPRKVRNAVWARDGARCVFASGGGRCCEARRGLELDHVVPFSAGGRSDDPGNLRLLCREHNQLQRRLALGEGAAGTAEETGAIGGGTAGAMPAGP